ncbi:MAG: SiaB family protein kinase [Crocinitomicaceae bacterium]
MANIYDLYKTMESNKVMLSFKGRVTSDLLMSVLQIMETKLVAEDESPKVRKKIYNVLVECLQNLYHHIDKEKEMTKSEIDEQSAIFMIAKDGNQYSIMTGNYMDSSDVTKLEDKLKLINSMDKDELKQYYKTVLADGQRSDKGTAGLGMIDIARKSGQKLEYHFLPIDTVSTFFSLNVKIA